MTEWNIQSRSEACTNCSNSFGDKEVYHTILMPDTSGYLRRDLCETCVKEVPRDGMLSYWQGEYRLPLPPVPEPMQRDKVEMLLRQLIESDNPEDAEATYVLMVMLERKRIVHHRLTQTTESGIELLVYEHAKTGELFTIPDPHLRLDQLEHVQQRVIELLENVKVPRTIKDEADPSNEPASSALPVASS